MVHSTTRDSLERPATFFFFFPSPQQTLRHIRGLSNKFSVTIDPRQRNDFDSTVESMDDGPLGGPADA